MTFLKKIISVILSLVLVICGLPICLNMAITAKASDNLISNPSFEEELDGWELYNGNTADFNVEIASDEYQEGEKSLYRYVGGTDSIYNQLFYSSFELKADTEYILSFWIKGDPAWGRFYITDNSDPKTLDHSNTSDKALWFQWTGQTYDNWTRLDYSFYADSNAKHNLYFYFSSPATKVYLDNFSLKENFAENMVENGSFSEGNSGWEFDSTYFNVNEKNYLDVSAAYRKVASQTVALPGKYIDMGFSGWLNQVVNLSKGVKYDISLDVFFPESLTSGFDLEIELAKRVTYFGTERAITVPISGFNYGASGWQTVTASILATSELMNGGSTAKFYFGIRSSSANSDIIINNVKFANLLVNGNFDAENNLGWSIDSSALTSDKLLYGQNLKLSFKYKGTGFKNNVALWCLSSKKDFDPLNTYVRGFVSGDAPDWKEASFVFSGGNQNSINLLFQTLDNAYCIDNISLAPTNDPATVTPLDRAYFVEEMSGSYYSKYKQPKSAYNVISNADFVGTASKTTNDALSFTTTSNGGKAAGKVVSNSQESGASYLGNSSLKFEAGLDEESVLIPLSLEKNTTYWLSLYIKAGPYLADENGWSRFSYGIADTSSGNFIRAEDLTVPNQENLVFADRIQCIPRYDGEWHYLGLKFTTNGQTDLSFMLRGSRMTAYVDKLYVWKDYSSYTEDFKATLNKIGPIKNIKTETSLLDMSSSGTNLVTNSDFENGEEFWGQEYRRVGVYGNNLNIVNSGHITHKNAFLYENKLLYPWNCYYIKWIDVKPNTDYTFSAKFLVTKTGEGYFGAVAGYKNTADVCSATENMLYPSNGLSTWVGSSYEDMFISKWDFSEANFDANYNWKTVGVTFNSGDRNRIGFYIQDGGGTAYIDDVKLFETKYAVAYNEQEVQFPESFIVKQGSVSVIDGEVKGIPQGATLSELRNYFEYGNYIRFFGKDGNEITDLNTLAEKGIELRLMNGPVVKASAVIKEISLITNGGFEDGLNGWSRTYFNGSYWLEANASVVTDTYNGGANSLQINNGGKAATNKVVFQKLTLEPNTKYILSFYIKGDPAYGRFVITDNFDVPHSVENSVLNKQWLGDTFNSWTKQSFTFFTDERTEYILSLCLTAAATNVYFDDFSLVKDTNILTNYSFESGLDGWTVDAGGSGKNVNAEVVNAEKHNGDCSLHRWLTELTYNQTVYQHINLKSNAKYKLSFWIKGNPEYGRFYISGNVDSPINRDFVLIEKQLTAIYNDWTKLEYTFTTGKQNDYILCLLFQSGGVDVYFDDFQLELFESLGDISQNGITDSEDLILLKKYLIGIKTNIFDSTVADIVKDKDVNILDYVRLKRLLAES